VAPTLLALRDEHDEARRERMMEKERQRREMERLRKIEKDEEQRVRSQSGIIDDGIDNDDVNKKKETEEDENENNEMEAKDDNNVHKGGMDEDLTLVRSEARNILLQLRSHAAAFGTVRIVRRGLFHCHNLQPGVRQGIYAEMCGI
jgi:hypothetical protein